MDRTFPEQLANTEANTNKELKLRREMACEKHVRQLEITRRRTTIAAASQSFFDRLALLSVRESIHAFEAQREALLNFCLQQTRGEVDAYELDTIHRDVVQMIAKAQHELQNKLARQEKDESHVAQKKIALQQLKKYQHEQIEQHLANSKAQRKQELAARECVMKEQARLDRGVEARELERQQFTEAHRKKLAEQIENNVVARNIFQLAVQGSSPLYRTPWWSDESDERVKGFQRPMTVQMPTHSPVIQCKKRCQSYD
ncbi:hypothetical protein PRNP1_001167 [Phytophthora ramorum]